MQLATSINTFKRNAQANLSKLSPNLEESFSQKSLGKTLGHTGPISGVAAFRDKYVATAGYDNRVILWDARSGRPLGVGFHDHLANQCRFNLAGTLLVSTSSDHSARIWNVPSMTLRTVLLGHSDDVEAASLSHCGSKCATTSRDATIKIFDVATGTCTKTISGHLADVVSVEWDLTDAYLTTCSDDGTIRKWNATTGEETVKYDNDGIQTDTVVIHPNEWIYCGDDHGRIHLFSGLDRTSFSAHNAGIKRLALSGQMLVSMSYDRCFKVWNIQPNGNLTLAHEAAFPAIIWPRSCALLKDSEDGDKIVFATFGSKYSTYSLASKTWIEDDVLETHGVNAVIEVNVDEELYLATVTDSGEVKIKGTDSIEIADLHTLCNFLVADEKRILTGGQEGKIFECRLDQPNAARVVYQHNSPLNCCVQVNANSIAIGTYTGELIFLKKDNNGSWNFDELLKVSPNAIKGVACNDQTIFSVGAACDAAWIDIRERKVVQFMADAHQKIANGCAYSKYLNAFISISRDLNLRVWKKSSLSNNLVQKYEYKSRTIPSPHTHSIKCVASDTSGRFIATGSYNGRIAIFDCVLDLWIQSEKYSITGISSLCYSERHQTFFASSYDGGVYDVRFL